MNRTYLRGDMYYADLGRGIGSEQEGYRPVLILQNNTGNKYSPTVIVAANFQQSGRQGQAAHPLSSPGGKWAGTAFSRSFGTAPHH